MKTVSKLATAIIFLAINSPAQIKYKNGMNELKPGTYVPHATSPNNIQASSNTTNASNQWVVGIGNGNPSYNGYGNINFSFGNYSNYPMYNYPINYPNPYYGYYGTNYNLRKSAKYSLRVAANVINDAVGFDSWNEIYSPILAKAIRHYNYAQQLYWWGNYDAALNHAERARYLAWYSLQYFQNPYGFGNSYNNGYNESNPYSDPYNPYYKSANSGAGNIQKTTTPQNAAAPASNSLDENLPTDEKNDRALIKSFDKNNQKDE